MTTSDIRIKKNIVDNNKGLDIINQIKIKNFEYKTQNEITDLPNAKAVNTPGLQIGVIAQELQQISPECVTDNGLNGLSINTTPLFWYLINSVKELSEKINDLSTCNCNIK